MPIETTDDGIWKITCINDEHSLNASPWIDFTEDGITICFNNEQFVNEQYPIEVIQEGINIFLSLGHFLKKKLSILACFNNK